MRAILAALFLSLFAAPAASTISGRVTEAGTGRALPRILVTLVGSDARELAQTLTDGDGRYSFSGVPAGRYAVSAEPGEHRADHLRQWFDEKEPAPRWGRPPRYPLDVAEGSDLTGIDMAMLVALGIEGRILAPWEEGMANVPVVATRPDGSRATDNPVYSDDLGNYRLFGLAPGRYRVCASPESRAVDGDATTTPFVQTCYPAAFNDRAAADVTLTSRDVIGIDVRVQRTGGRTISGTVVDAEGKPANGAFVIVSPSDPASFRTMSAMVRDGAFSLAGLVPGSYNLTAWIGGRSVGDRNSPSRTREMAFAQADVTAVDAPSLTLALTPPVKVRGRVVYEGDPPSARQRARMVARAFPLDAPMPPIEAQGVGPVAEDATFELPDIYKQPVVVSIQNLPDGWMVKGVRLDGRDVTYVPADFSVSREPVEVTLTNRLARATVRVTDDQGRAVSNARVLVVPYSARHGRTRFGAVDARPDANGDITLGPLTAGEYLIVALTLDDLNLLFFDPARLATLGEIATKVTLREDEQSRIDLRLVALPERR